MGWISGGGPLGPVGDLVTVIDPPMQPAGGLQGFLITKSWADENHITHLGQINDDPVLAAALDGDGDGLGEIHGCPERWTCDDIINSFLHFNEWSSLEQLQGVTTSRSSEPNATAIDDFLDLVGRGEPAVGYVWTPTSHYAVAAVGEKTMWLSVTDAAALNGMQNMFYPGAPDPELLRADGSSGFNDLPAEICTQGPDGCQVGWVGSDITAAANAAWLDDNQTAQALLESIEFDTVETSQMLAELEKRELEDWSDKVDASMQIAQRWVEDNPDRTNAWLDAAAD